MAAPSTSESTQAAKPRLRRGLRVLGTLLITLSAITPASSVFIISPGVIGQAGSGAFWSFVIAGVVGIFRAFVYAELASAYPLSGGEYAIVARTLGKLPGFVTLGLLLITQLLIIAVIALGVGTYLSVIFPNLNAPTVAAVTTLLPVAPILALVALGYVVYENALDPVVGRPSLYVTVGIGVVSAAYYLLVLRRRGTWELHGAADE